MTQAPALQPQSCADTDEAGGEEEGEQQDFRQPSGQAKRATAAARLQLGFSSAPPGKSPPSLSLSLSFGCVSPNVLFRARELPFNSSRKQLRNLCFF